MKLKTKNVVPVIAIGVVIWYLYSRRGKKATASEPTKADYANTIISSGNFTSFAALMNFDEDFIKVWATAAKAGQPKFVYNGKTYNTKGGKAYQTPVKKQPDRNMSSPIMNR